MRLERFGSLQTLNDPLDVGLGGLTVAENVDIDIKGRVSSRAGRIKAFSGVIDASLSDGGMLLFLSDGVIYIATGDDGFAAMGCDEVITGGFIVAAMAAGVIYFNTGDYQGVIIGSTVRRLGVPLPLSIVATATTGALRAGRYLFSASCIAPDGRESGVPGYQYIDINEGEGFVVDVGTPKGYQANVYISSCDGTQLYYAGAGISATFMQQSQMLHLGQPSVRDYFKPLPCGQFMVYNAGRLLSAVNDVLFVSEPLDYESCDFTTGVIPFAGRITMLTAVDGGVYLADTMGILFITGNDAKDFSPRIVDYSQVIEGSACKLDMSKMGDGSTVGNAVIFVTTKGAIRLGLPNGQSVNPITDREVYINPPSVPVVAAIVNGKYILTRLMWAVHQQSFDVTPRNDCVRSTIIMGLAFSINASEPEPLVNWGNNIIFSIDVVEIQPICNGVIII